MKRVVFGTLGLLAAAMILGGPVWGQGGGPSAAGQPPHKTIGTMKLLVFQGQREGAPEPFKAVTASYLNFTVSANIQAEADQAAQAARIKQVFNLKDVSLLTEAELTWEPGQADKAFHFFQLDKTFYLVMVTPLAIGQKRFRIEVFEQNGGAKINLLDTEFTLPEKNTAVFGFSDKDGKPYFLSMQTTSWPAPEVVVEGAVVGDAVRAVGDIRPPRLVREVAPIYPPVARQAKVEGTVILEAQTDIYGRVQNIKVLRSIPLLDQAAIDAVRQWVYEPMMIDGRNRPMIFTVTVRFARDTARAFAMPNPSKGDKDFAVFPAAIPITYPKEAIAKKLQGTVEVEAVIDAKGSVSAVNVIKSVHPMLDKAAIDGLNDHVFKPAPGKSVIKSGPVALSVVFHLPSEESAEVGGVAGGVMGGVVGGVMGGVIGGTMPKEAPQKPVDDGDAVRCVDNIQPPKLVRQVAPIYPEAARQAMVEGVVIMEVLTDIYGRIASVKILRSIPLLDQAAIDSVRQWVYEPLVIDGRKRPAIFTTTVRFNLK
ncbi:MAG: energy transducer TonB [Candidatus Aminicenantes bacterium]|nr:energy transducer TonB [Candidatus Aminicenantes bacterium]